MKRFLCCLCSLFLLAGCSSQISPTPSPTPPQYDRVVIALLDTGISTIAISPDCLLPGHNYVLDSADTEDRINHGTATASIIAGCAKAEIPALAPNALLVPLVVTDKVDGKATSISPQLLAQAVRDAVDVYGANIINVSLGIQKDVPALREAVEYAHSQGVLVVSAVGNDGADGPLYYPAAYPAALGVGSHDRDGSVSSFSQQNGTADLLAPGEDIWMASRNAAVYGAKGTSYATAHATAIAALLLASDPTLTPDSLCQALYARTTDVGEPGWDTQSGWGILRLTDS